MDSSDWDERYGATELVWSTDPSTFVRETYVDFKPGTILDLGCGEGRNALWFASIGWQATGVDFSQAAIEKARSIAAAKGSNATFEVADLTKYEPENSFYDAVVVCYIHLDASALEAIWLMALRALAPSGTLLIVGHDLDNLAQGSGGPQDPSVLFEPNDVLLALVDAKVIRSEKVTRTLTDPNGETKVAIDALVVVSKE